MRSLDARKHQSLERTDNFSRGARVLALALLATLAACAPFEKKPTGEPIVRTHSRWVPAEWNELPGWDDDRVLQAWPVLLRSCERPASEWTSLCAKARAHEPSDERQARAWFKEHLRPYRVEPLQGRTDGLITGYYEPIFDARRQPTAKFRVPLYAPPTDLATRKPYWTRREIDTLGAAQASLRGRELAYLADPLDALALQIQGSGRLHITEPDGRVRTVRMAYASNNGQPYASVGRWLIDQGELPPGQASWPAIRAWAERNPGRIDELLWANPRYVFFREEPITDPAVGPRGAQGVPLTPGRSIAVDPKGMPYGTPAWIDTTAPSTSQPLRRLVIAQDTGSAIVGPVRADYFWGWGSDAATEAGRMKQPLRMWVLWPRN
jgi:membrane-bound lytic murein transglycosylase A